MYAIRSYYGMKAIATVSMYNMGDAARYGLNKSTTLEQRQKIIKSAIEQRLVEYTGGKQIYVPGTINKLDENTPTIQREFYDFYRTERGAFTPKGEQSDLTTKPRLSSISKFMNFYPFNRITSYNVCYTKLLRRQKL